MSQKHISKDGKGRIISKVTKPKDWAFRTPSEGRPKSVHSRQAKPVKFEHLYIGYKAAKLWIETRIVKGCLWKISCENPNRTLTAQDILDFYNSPTSKSIEVKINYDLKLLIFPDLTDILTGGHEDSDSIPTQLTKAEIEIAKHPIHVLKEVYPCKKCGKYGPCKCGPKFNKCNVK